MKMRCKNVCFMLVLYETYFDGAIKIQFSSLAFHLFLTSFIVNTNCYSLDFGVHINLEVTTYSRVE